MAFFRNALKLSLAAGLTACGGSDDAPAGKGEAGPEPDLSAKADAFYWPTENGTVTFGKAAAATFGPDSRFHAFDFELSGDGFVELRTDSDNEKRDTVLYLYQQTENGWGRYIAKNDDDGRYLLSSVEAALGAGKYRALVKGYKTTEKGDFTLTVDCSGDGCAPAVPADVVPGACLFGNVYRDVAASPNFEVVESRRNLDADSLFQKGEDEAFFNVVKSITGWDDINSLEDAFESADQGIFNYMMLRDAFSGDTYQVIEYGAGDTSVGGIIDAEGKLSAEISDGDLWPCNVLEPRGRFAGLRFEETTVPEAWTEVPGVKAAKVVGLEPGQMLSLGSDEQVFNAMTELFDESCTGVAQEFAPFNRGTGYETHDYFVLETEDWESALGDAADKVADWADEGWEHLEIFKLGLEDEACGGSGAGDLVLVHDRRTQVITWHIMVEWSE